MHSIRLSLLLWESGCYIILLKQKKVVREFWNTGSIGLASRYEMTWTSWATANLRLQYWQHINFERLSRLCRVIFHLRSILARLTCTAWSSEAWFALSLESLHCAGSAANAGQGKSDTLIIAEVWWSRHARFTRFCVSLSDSSEMYLAGSPSSGI